MTVSELVNELEGSEDVSSVLGESSLFTEVAEKLTESLCSVDSFDFIVQDDKDFWLLVSNEQTGEYEPEYLGTENSFVLRWNDEHIGQEDLSEDQVAAISGFLKEELPGFEIVYSPTDKMLSAEIDKWFSNEISRYFDDAVENAFQYA